MHDAGRIAAGPRGCCWGLCSYKREASGGRVRAGEGTGEEVAVMYEAHQRLGNSHTGKGADGLSRSRPLPRMETVFSGCQYVLGAGSVRRRRAQGKDRGLEWRGDGDEERAQGGGSSGLSDSGHYSPARQSTAATSPPAHRDQAC
ncbi:hypothetical protein E2C01_011007 [Portunus trituberculatus]|uniref:Uncharacterized protein n=1 Tax=Portunus trituberculatus TaxID=210409 RepID=A0A5B7D9Z5_PORTR|nr:hypothetical protein [Portunus trituberculatus]